MGEIDATHDAVGRPGQQHQDLVFAQRQAVIGDQLGAELASERGMGADQATYGHHGRGSFRGQMLSSQVSLL